MWLGDSRWLPAFHGGYFFGVAAKSPPSSVYFLSLTFSFSSLVEEAIEDVEGPSEAAADPEELAKDQESGGEKDQSKWTGSVCGCPPAPMFLSWRREANRPGGRRSLGPLGMARLVFCGWETEYILALLQWLPSFSYYFILSNFKSCFSRPQSQPTD